MKRITLILFFIPLSLFSQVKVNNDSLIYYFNILYNEYREEYGLGRVEINVDLKGFTDEWTMHLSQIDKVTHGDGNLSFKNRVNNYSLIPSHKTCLENCTQAFNPSSPTPKDETIESSQTELLPYIEKIMRWECTQKDFAIYIMIAWKNSPPHNESLLDPNITNYYVSSNSNKECTYFSWIGMN